MLVAAIAAVIALAFAVLLIAVGAGVHRAHPTDLALQPPTFLAVFARRVLGLYVRRDEPLQSAAADADPDQVAR